MTHSSHSSAPEDALSQQGRQALPTYLSVSKPDWIPDAAYLREVALAHVARFATTQQSLHDVLQRRVRRWITRTQRASISSEQNNERGESAFSIGDLEAYGAALSPVIERIIAEMVALGAVDDARFARSRAENMTKSGRSRRAVTARLLAKGVDPGVANGALTESLGEFSAPSGQEAELAAALILTKKRNLGPFSRYSPSYNGQECRQGGEEQDEDAQFIKEQKEKMRIMGIFARNGFAYDVARKALEMERDEAEEYILAFRTR